MENLAPLSPCPPPFLSLLSGVFLNVILRVSPFLLWCVPGRLFVAGNTFLSSPFLSLSLSFLLPSFWCVPGRMCRSREHLCLLLSFPLFSSSPCPLFPRARRVYKQTRLLQQVFLMRFGLSSVCSRSFGSPFIAPTDGFFPLFFHVFLSSCLFILILSFLRAHYRPDLSLYTYTHAYFTYSEVQVAQVRYNEVWLIGCPSSLGSFSSATTHTFVCLVLLIFICPFLRAHVPTSFPGRMEVTHASLRGGVCVCVTLGIIGILLDLLGLLSYFLTVVPAGGLVVHASTSPTKRLALNTDIGGDAHRRTCIFRTLRKWNPRPACGTAFSSAPCSHRDPVGLRSSFSAGGSGRSLGTATNEDAHLIW